MKQRVAYVAFWHGIDPAEIYKPKGRVGSRRQQILEARHDAIVAVVTARPDWSYPRLGRFFGLDHATVLNALRRRGAWTPRKPAIRSQ